MQRSGVRHGCLPSSIAQGSTYACRGRALAPARSDDRVRTNRVGISSRGQRAHTLAQALGERLQQFPPDGRVSLHERAELPERQAVADELGRRRDRGGACPLVDERDLAEVVARARSRRSLPPTVTIASPDSMTKNAAPPDTLLGDRLARGEAALLEQARDLLEIRAGSGRRTAGPPADVTVDAGPVLCRWRLVARRRRAPA